MVGRIPGPKRLQDISMVVRPPDGADGRSVAEVRNESSRTIPVPFGRLAAPEGVRSRAENDSAVRRRDPIASKPVGGRSRGMPPSLHPLGKRVGYRHKPPVQHGLCARGTTARRTAPWCFRETGILRHTPVRRTGRIIRPAGKSIPSMNGNGSRDGELRLAPQYRISSSRYDFIMGFSRVFACDSRCTRDRSCGVSGSSGGVRPFCRTVGFPATTGGEVGVVEGTADGGWGFRAPADEAGPAPYDTRPGGLRRPRPCRLRPAVASGSCATAGTGGIFAPDGAGLCGLPAIRGGPVVRPRTGGTP